MTSAATQQLLQNWRQDASPQNTYEFIAHFASLLRTGTTETQVQNIIGKHIDEIITQIMPHILQKIQQLQQLQQLDLQNNIAAFFAIRDELELIYQLLWNCAVDLNSASAQKWETIREKLDEVDDKILFQPQQVQRLQKIATEKQLINLDSDYYWWIPSTDREKYFPEHRLTQHIANYIEQKMHGKVDLQLYNFFREMGYLDIVRDTEDTIYMDKMSEDAKSIVNVLQLQAPAMAASTTEIIPQKYSWCDLTGKYKVNTFIEVNSDEDIFLTIYAPQIPQALRIGSYSFEVIDEAQQGTYCVVNREKLQQAFTESSLIELAISDTNIVLSPQGV